MHHHWKALDGLRAVAIGIVLLAHAGAPYPRSGGVGVDIFFVLSGFLITGILFKEHQRCGFIHKKHFYIRRFLRLSPALFATVFLFALLSYFSFQSVRLDVVVIALTYTANYARALFNYDLQSLEHFWSLAIEEQYYLVWPLIIAFLERHLKRAVYKFAVLLLSAFLLAYYRWAMVDAYGPIRIYFALDTHMDGLVMGSALAYLAAALAGANKTNALNVLLRVLSYVVVPLAIAGTLTIMYFVTWLYPWMARWGFSLVALATALVILDLVASPFSLIRRLLENTAFVYSGKISYGLYLYHLPIFHFIKRECAVVSPFIQAAIMIATTFLVASLSYRFIEKPFLKLKERFSHGGV